MAAHLNETTMENGQVPAIKNSRILSDNFTFPPSWAKCVCCKVTPNTPNVISLSCLHVCCSEACLDKIFREETGPYCHECGMLVERDSVYPCAYINDGIDARIKMETQKDNHLNGNQRCTLCVRETIASKWCIECQEFLCELCSSHHQYAMASQSHSLVPKSMGVLKNRDDLAAKPTGLKCPMHSEIEVVSFCDDCHAGFCPLCSSNHLKHNTRSLAEMSKDVRSGFYDSTEDIIYIKQKCEEVATELESKIGFILNEQYEFLLTEARAFFQRVMDQLLQREHQFRKDLKEITVAKAKELNTKRAKSESIAMQCEQFLCSSKEILEQGTVFHVLQHKTIIEKQLGELLKMVTLLKDPSQLNNMVEKHFCFCIDPRPVVLAEKCIQKFCEVRYRDVTGNKGLKMGSPICDTDAGSLETECELVTDAQCVGGIFSTPKTGQSMAPLPSIQATMEQNRVAEDGLKIRRCTRATSLNERTSSPSNCVLKEKRAKIDVNNTPLSPGNKRTKVKAVKNGLYPPKVDKQSSFKEGLPIEKSSQVRVNIRGGLRERITARF